MVEADHPSISIVRQCELLGLPRSTRYYQRVESDAGNEKLMRLLDEQYTRTPFYGVRRMRAWLVKQGHAAGPKRVRRLMRQMGLSAIYPKPHLSKPGAGHRVYPYLLGGVEIGRCDQVWSTDITYIRMRRGHIYLAAVMDWFSRYVLSWELSLSLEVDFCVVCLESAFASGQPEIFNSDQGSQFTSETFTGKLLQRGVLISMDGRGRALDNVLIERLWRSVKYEEVYLNAYENVWEARERIDAYFEFYNHQRLHQSLRYETPASVYLSRAKTKTAKGVQTSPSVSGASP